METTLAAEKQLVNVTGQLQLPGSPALTGYEIHMGVSHGPALARPAAVFADGRADGALSDDGQMLATYCHGLFDTPQSLAALLAWAGADLGFVPGITVDPVARREADLNRLADATAAAIDWEKWRAALPGHPW